MNWMQQAIDLGKKGRVTAPPNPWVGCVIVKNGDLIGEGFTQPAGESHAEIEALKQAGGKAAGATVYVTLEPCSHHGRTPPCVDALIKAKVAKVVIGIKDPDPKVSGEGIRKLQQAGIEVEVQDVEQSLEAYLHHRKTGKPYVVLKAATSIDGRIAAKDGSSKWISSPEARKDVHRIRAESQAILVGAGTYLNDSPQLTVRDTDPLPANQPLRIILDSKADLPPNKEMILATTKSASPKGWKEVIQISSLEYLLAELGKRGIIQLLVEGGGKVHSSFLQQNLFDELVVYISPKILGDEGIPLFQNLLIPTMKEAPKLILKGCQIFGDTARLTLQKSGHLIPKAFG